ncbi:BolA family protein [Ferrimonas lipolytica]|uniref:BolA/IbaG family iron-sulfur metabolism protein n=1 Tax=Ferrimonas lipolytica TaxID=2724191 RepID=A0A6H1U976_9GAMM|nr:BolA/IbaG family iron-sulfur metabolism protein [Ferrimonas lipolytica]QIZ75597.1 BolA/IbaG family iron-sulfur metabolism protein [Ferrimonas lipolytica]
MSMKQTITEKVTEALATTHLDVINESHMHRGPAQDSHYKLIVVSDRFEGERLLARHRRINAILANELSGELHALALHTYTPTEWAEQQGAPRTPSCVS